MRTCSVKTVPKLYHPAAWQWWQFEAGSEHKWKKTSTTTKTVNSRTLFTKKFPTHIRHEEMRFSMATMVQLCVQRNWTNHHMRTTALHHFVQTRTRWASIAFSNLFVCLFFGHAQWCLYFKRTHNRNRKGKMDI